MPQLDLPTGVRLAYLDPHPQGRTPVLLIHGLGSAGESWREQFPALNAAGFRPIAPDVRGFGRSSSPGKWSIPDAVADLKALLDALGLPRAHVVGISMGGVLAQQLALDFPQAVERLVLVNTFARLRPGHLGGWLYFLLRLILVYTVGIEAQARTVAQRIFPDHPEARAMLRRHIQMADPRAYRAAMRALGLFNSTHRLAEIQAPTLVVTGLADTTVPPENQAELARRIPHARWLRIPGAGHGLIATHAPVFNPALVAFLQGREESSPLKNAKGTP